MNKLLPILLILFAAPSLCFAMDGNKLLRFCEHAEGSGGSLTCTAYIAGAADTLASTSIICIVGLEYGQMQKVVKKYLINNPELLHHSANILVKNALQKDFPCK